VEDQTEKIDIEVVDGLTEFFDLLARYDFEDNKKEKLELNSDSLVSAPRGSRLDSNYSK
jgi:hypothetical protein